MPPALALPLLLLATAPAPSGQALGLDAQRALLRPTEAELAYQQIPWRTELEGAVAEARAQRKPLAVWVENGHPLAGT